MKWLNPARVAGRDRVDIESGDKRLQGFAGFVPIQAEIPLVLKNFLIFGRTGLGPKDETFTFLIGAAASAYLRQHNERIDGVGLLPEKFSQREFGLPGRIKLVENPPQFKQCGIIIGGAVKHFAILIRGLGKFVLPVECET